MLDFLFFYETKNREFESIVLLRNELVKRGYTVEFFSFWETRNYTKCRKYFNKVKIAVMPSLYHDEEILQFVYRVAGNVQNIVNLRWEQVFTHDTEMDENYYVYPKGYAKDAFICCWGQKPKKMLMGFGIPPEKLEVTGPIQMDMLNEKLRGYYLTKSQLFKKYSIPVEKKSILFISSFSVSTFKQSEIDKFVLQFKGKERENYLEFIETQNKTRKILSEWFIKLAENMDCTIIYRPHPTEYDTPEISRFKDSSRIKVISEENVKQWILTCDQIFSWYSTSYAEAYLAGKQCDILRPVKLRHGDDLPIYDGMEFITDFEQFQKKCTMPDTKLISNNNIHKYYDITRNKFSFERTADYLERILNNENYFNWRRFNKKDKITVRLLSVKDELLILLYEKILENRYFFSLIKKCCHTLLKKKKSWDSFMSDNYNRNISQSDFISLEKKLNNLIY